jgi:hypothetical protein
MRPKKNPSDKSEKKSVSFPPEMWKYIERKAPKSGERSRFLQAAVELLRSKDPAPSERGMDNKLLNQIDALAEERSPDKKRR